MMPALAIEESEPQTIFDVTVALIEARLDETPDFPKLVAWLAKPAVCEYLAKENKPSSIPFEWWKSDSFKKRLRELSLPQALALFDPLAQMAKWIEDGCNGDAWETEAFLDLLLSIVLESEIEFRALLKAEIEDRELSGNECEVSGYLQNMRNLLQRLTRTQ